MPGTSLKTVNSAVAVADVVTTGLSFAPERVATNRSFVVGPTSSLQLPTATRATTVNPPNKTCLRMSASVPLEVKEGLHQRRSYAYPPTGTCQAAISNRNHQQPHLLIPSPCGSSPPVPLTLRQRGNEGRVEFPLSRRERG